jgi:hypothetical protein
VREIKKRLGCANYIDPVTAEEWFRRTGRFCVKLEVTGSRLGVAGAKKMVLAKGD